MPRVGCACAVIAAALAATSCIEQKLTVEIRTEIHADGSATRHTEYRLEAVNRAPAGDAPTPLAADALRRYFRFPVTAPWALKEDSTSSAAHAIVLDAEFPTLDGFDWDYWRARSPKAPASRNRVSFAYHASESEASYEYAETFVDPVSPLASARMLARLLPKQDGRFAAALRRALTGSRPPTREAKRVFRQTFAEPLAQAIMLIAARRIWGPRERQVLEQLFDSDDASARNEALVASLVALAPGTTPEDMKTAVDAAFESVLGAVEHQMDAAGTPILLAGGEDPSGLDVHFRATLVMPIPITRANGCFQDNTITWEFDEEDLYGAGFEMRAKATTP